MPKAAPRRTRPPLSFWQRAEWARQEGLITWGALAYLRTLARLARARGDGRSFVLGERVIEEITGIERTQIRRWRGQLEAAGLIEFRRKWAYKRGWFWEARTSLIFATLSGHKMCPEEQPVSPGTKCARNSGHKMCPSLNGTEEPSVKGSGRRGKPRRVNPQRPGVAATPAATPTAPAATTAGDPEASKVKEAPPPGPTPAPAQTADAKGQAEPRPTADPAEPSAPRATPWVDPHRIIPPEEAARRIRELIERLRHVAKPDPTEPPETH